MTNNGMLYLIRRDGSEIQFLCRISFIKKFIRNVNPHEIGLKLSEAKRAAETIEINKMDWEPYAEPGDIQEIINKWKLKGKNFEVGLKPTPKFEINISKRKQTFDHELRRLR